MIDAQKFSTPFLGDYWIKIMKKKLENIQHGN
jgi:hypothetical protein